MSPDDPIVAISSAVGPAARMIVRVSGSGTLHTVGRLCDGLPPASTAARRDLRFAGLTVPATVYTFHGPRSYTGQDLVELHVPGNVLLARLLVGRLQDLGCRPAEPGEFTARAYFNGKLDLAEAEGVAAAVAATSAAQARAARQLMSGELARRLRPVTDAVAELLALVEVGIDFTDEDVTFLAPAALRDRVAAARADLAAIVRDSDRFERLSHEPRVVLVGRPNVGKSTLLNALAGYERAVVSPVAGTTRDALSADVVLRRGIVRLIDVAGLDDRDDGPAAGEVERQMRDRANRAVAEADVVVLVRDASDPQAAPPAVPRDPDLTVWNKTDLAAAPHGALGVSGRCGMNLHTLRLALDEAAFGSDSSGGLALTARHVTALGHADAALDRAVAASTTGAGDEVVAMDLRDALDQLGEVLGAVAPDDVLGLVFSRFCIGK